MSTYNVHAGHNFIVPGAGGQFSETEHDRKVKDKVIELLRKEGHTVYDCTDEAGKTVSQNLANIVAKCNAHPVDLDISIHFNAFNKSAHGTEVYMYNNNTIDVATRICAKIATLGYVNRGPKIWNELYVLRHTNSKAILIECCFCDSPTDAAIYNKSGADGLAKAIVEGILNKTISGGTTTNPNKPSADNKYYRVRKTWADAKSQLGAYTSLTNAKKNCPTGYNVYDWNGKVVYSNKTNTSSDPNTKLYRVRTSWDDAKSQVGAYSSLDNAKKSCPEGYNVYDWNGKVVYSNPKKEEKLYRVRKTWDDTKSQLGAYKSLDNAEKNCPPGYSVFDWKGDYVFTVATDMIYRVRKSWDDTKSQIGAFEDLSNAKSACKSGYAVYNWYGEEVYRNNDVVVNPTLETMDNTSFIEYIGQLAREDMKKTGILASITIAQAILESGWGKTILAIKANNLFGMKATLSGNTWKSDWNGKKYAVYTKEEYDGKIVTILADFRAYDTIAQSIKDHSDYLCGAKNGSKLRYEGLKGETDYTKAIRIIKNGGYATDSQYVSKIENIIKTYNLDVFDTDRTPSDNYKG